jgi:hypothetical protein
LKVFSISSSLLWRRQRVCGLFVFPRVLQATSAGNKRSASKSQVNQSSTQPSPVSLVVIGSSSTAEQPGPKAEAGLQQQQQQLQVEGSAKQSESLLAI